MPGQNNNLCTKKYFTQQASLTSDRHDKIHFITVTNIFMGLLKWMLFLVYNWMPDSSPNS